VIDEDGREVVGDVGREVDLVDAQRRERVDRALDEAPDGVLLGALALADRTRLRMLRRLSASPCGNAEMADFLGVNPSTASRHFKLFKDAGLVELRGAEGARLEYELAPEGLDAALRAIAEYVQGGRT